MPSMNEIEKKDPQTPGPESATGEGQKAAEQSSVTKVDVLHTFVEEYKARDDQNFCFQKRNFWLGVTTAVLLFAYTTITFLQWRTMYQSFQASQRAFVALGLPDGKIADFLPGNNARHPQRLKFYFRNYGATTAQNTRIHLWPVTTAPGQGARLTFEPFDKKHPLMKELGVDIPPGFPQAVNISYPDATREELDTEQKNLVIWGRIAYVDMLGEHCEVFGVIYDQEFILVPGQLDACATRNIRMEILKTPPIQTPTPDPYHSQE